MTASVADPLARLPALENFELSLHLTHQELEYHLRLMAALKMFELGQISSGKASELCGMTRLDFFATCSRYRISMFNYPPEELANELQNEAASFPE